ncbi:MAG: hypothetical protein JO038_03345 [Alphaproteobacteria bacterium]|nr:hypothetical protein [Alphaproteobacteria bacterium]
MACGEFTKIPIAEPVPREDPHALERLRVINAAVKTKEHPILFLGDSITERWPAEIWRSLFEPRDAINAGIDGDRTEHLLWRLDHGNLDGQPPKAVVLLIGTNDLGHGRSTEMAAEGIRANLIRLTERLPATQIFLLGLTPRSDRFSGEIETVNRKIATCQGGFVLYTDLSESVLDAQHHLSRELSVDGVHFTEAGYARLAARLTALLDKGRRDTSHPSR